MTNDRVVHQAGWIVVSIRSSSLLVLLTLLQQVAVVRERKFRVDSLTVCVFGHLFVEALVVAVELPFVVDADVEASVFGRRRPPRCDERAVEIWSTNAANVDRIEVDLDRRNALARASELYPDTFGAGPVVQHFGALAIAGCDQRCADVVDGLAKEAVGRVGRGEELGRLVLTFLDEIDQ